MTPQSVSARVLARRLAMQAVYQIEMAGQEPDVVKKQFRQEDAFGRADADYFDLLVDASREHTGEINKKISEISATEISRIDPVERAILRNAVYEMLYIDDIDDAVVITEAVRLAKKFGSVGSYRFVNSALHRLSVGGESLSVGGESLSEKEIIRSFFTPPVGDHFPTDHKHPRPMSPMSKHTILGPGDDAAVIDVGSEERLLCCTDTLVEGVHFLPDTPAVAVGHKALAVSLSDMAAMGAIPKWATVALTVPHNDRAWFADFSDGLFRLAEVYETDIIGGDLTRGKLTVTTQVIGVAEGEIMLRSGAHPGDGIYVTGHIGGAAMAWRHPDHLDTISKESGESAMECVRRMRYPQPRVRAGTIIARYASAGIDISDGLLKELREITGGYGAEIHIDRLPLNRVCEQFCTRTGDYTTPLAGGDDYELLFTMPEEHEEALTGQLCKYSEETRAQDTNVQNKQRDPHDNVLAVTRIGRVTASPGLTALLEGKPYALPECPGFDHFKQPDKIRSDD